MGKWTESSKEEEENVEHYKTLKMQRTSVIGKEQSMHISKLWWQISMCVHRKSMKHRGITL